MGAVQFRLTGGRSSAGRTDRRERKEKRGISSEMELIPTQFEPTTTSFRSFSHPAELILFAVKIGVVGRFILGQGRIFWQDLLKTLGT